MIGNWTGKLDISRYPDDDPRIWTQGSPISFKCWELGVLVTIRPGFKSDGTSAPRLFWWYTSPWTGNHAPGSLIHDGLYSSRLMNKDSADKLFYIALLDLGVRHTKAWLMYQSVRKGGGRKWIKYNGGKKAAEHFATVSVTPLVWVGT